MEVVADANIFLAVVLNESEKRTIIEHTKDMELISPEVLPYEVGNALIALLKRKRLQKEQIIKSFEIFNEIPVLLYSVDIGNAIEIACQFNIYAYDAYYLELAQRLHLPLLTLDKQMKNNAKELKIKTIEIES
jgi:predicted nucleic acid-binding protein